MTRHNVGQMTMAPGDGLEVRSSLPGTPTSRFPNEAETPTESPDGDGVSRNGTSAPPARHRRKRPRHRPRRGRKTLLESVKKQVLLTAISNGNRLPIAARLAGISPRTVEEWLARGRGHHARPTTPLHEAFVEEYEAAQARAEADALAMVKASAQRDWRAAAWYLENTSPHWRQRKTLPELEREPEPQPEQKPKSPTVITLTPEEIITMAKRSVARDRGDDPDSNEESDRLASLRTDISHSRSEDKGS